MLSVRNSNIGLYCLENGKNLSISDYNTGESWIMDEESLVYGDVDNAGGHKAKLKALIPLKAEKIANDKLCLTYSAAISTVMMIYTLCEEYIEVVLSSNISDEIGIVSFPGSFNSSQASKKYLLPIIQGMLWDGRGKPFESRLQEAGHSGFTMAMLGIIGRKGGLLCTSETADDCLWWIGKDKEERTWATNLQVNSLGTMRYDRRVRLYLTKPTITDIAKTYRKRVIERGRFITWEEKIKERPALERLFGTIMCFIGYCQDELDYAKECEKLKAYGFDKALLYSVRFNSYSKEFLMGGFPPINLNKEVIKQIKALGYDVAPWS